RPARPRRAARPPARPVAVLTVSAAPLPARAPAGPTAPSPTGGEGSSRPPALGSRWLGGVRSPVTVPVGSPPAGRSAVPSCWRGGDGAGRAGRAAALHGHAHACALGGRRA